MHKVILDTDPGIDDGMAIQIALNASEIELLGLTTIFGNASVDLTTTNALRLLDIAQRTDIPVCKGASQALKRVFKGGVPQVHGEDGQGNTWHQPSTNHCVSPVQAHDFMAATIKKFPDEIALVAIGPLTNLALLLQEYPGIAEEVKEVVVMGGNAFASGNATPAAEANVLADPEAADVVFGGAWPISMVGLDVTHQVLMTNTQLDRIASYQSPVNQYVSATFHYYRRFFEHVNKIDGIYVHDSTAIVYLLNRSLFQTRAFPVRVETANTISLGKTWPSIGESDHENGPELQPWANRPAVNICVGVDAAAVLQYIEELLME